MQSPVDMAELVVKANNEVQAEEVVDVIERNIFSRLFNGGNVIILPVKCRVGDDVYFLIEDLSDTYITVQKVTDVSTKGFFVAASTEDEEESEYIPYSEIGKTVFFNLKKALKKLEKKNQSNKKMSQKGICTAQKA